MSDKKQTVQDEAAIITLEFDDGEVIECEEMGILITTARTTSHLFH